MRRNISTFKLIWITAYLILSNQALANSTTELPDTQVFTQKINTLLQKKTSQKRYNMIIDLVTDENQIKELSSTYNEEQGEACTFVNKHSLWKALSLHFAYQGIRPSEISPRVHLEKEWRPHFGDRKISVCEWTRLFDQSPNISYWYVLTVGTFSSTGESNDKIMWIFKTSWNHR